MTIYKYKVASNYNYYSERLRDSKHDCDEEFLRIYNGHITVKATESKQYAWDGCSPKIKVFGKIIGTPDVKGTWRASLFHDALYQYKIEKGLADLVFYDLMLRDKCKVAKLYYTGVKWLGRQ